MFCKQNITFYIIIFFALNLTKFCETNNSIRVLIKQNEFIGLEKEVLDKKVNVFLGIPYAEPPLAGLRFKKPLPSRKVGSIDAKEWPNACPQRANVTQSEDCLKLNIWSPHLSASKAVMLWFHGGGFVEGFGHNGEVLAVKGDVVVVTINYRLGALGFLYSGSDDAPGNLGLWDQVLAMEWVRDNIVYFGGNPEQITIFGESAGSRSISLHLVSPHSRHLFKNAIMMSGSAFSLLSYSEPEFVRNTYLRLAKLLGCNDRNDFSPKVMQCLRDISPENLVEAQHSKDIHLYSFGFSSNIIYGDKFMPEKPIVMLRNGDYKKKINLMVSTTDEEGSWIMTKIDSVRFSRENPINLTRDKAFSELQKLTDSIKIEPKINGKNVAKFYFERLPENNYDLLRRTIAIALGDFFISCPTLSFANILFDKNTKDNQIYQFYWTSKLGKYCGPWHGACHGSDVGPAFGYPFRRQSSDIEREVSTKLMNSISHFAKFE
jgi:carboxylesterase type B